VAFGAGLAAAAAAVWLLLQRPEMPIQTGVGGGPSVAENGLAKCPRLEVGDMVVEVGALRDGVREASAARSFWSRGAWCSMASRRRMPNHRPWRIRCEIGGR